MITKEIAQKVLLGSKNNFWFGNTTLSNNNQIVAYNYKDDRVTLNVIFKLSNHYFRFVIEGYSVFEIPYLCLTDYENDIEYLKITENLSPDFIDLLENSLEIMYSNSKNAVLINKYVRI